MSSSSILGTLVVRIAAEIRKYQADLNTAAKDTEAAAGRIGKSSTLANEAASRMGGGMGEAARAAQGLHAAAGLAGVGVGVLAAGVAAGAYAAYKGAQEQNAYQKALIMSGNAAGVTAGQMADMAAGIDKVVGTQAAAAAALAQMASTGAVAGGNLQKFSQLAVEMERSVGQSVGDTAKHFADLGHEPVKASIKLNEALNYLTASTFAQIKAAEDLGDKERAADIAQNAYADAMKSRTIQLEANTGTIERAWRAVRDAAKEAWDGMLGIGRQTTANEQLAGLQKKLADLQNEQARGGFGTNAGGAAFGGANTGFADAKRGAEIKALEAQIAALGGVAHAASEAAKAQGEKVAQDKAGIAWLQAGNQYMDRAAKLNQKITELTVEGVKAGASMEEIQRRIGIERDKAAEKGSKASKTAISEMERLAIAGQKLAESLLAVESGFSGDFAKKEQELAAAFAAGAISMETLVQVQALLMAQQPGAKAQTEALAKANLQAAEAHEKYVESLVKGLGKLEEDIAQQKLHNAEIGLGKDAIADLQAARLEDQAAMLEGQAIKQADMNLDMVQYELLMAQAKALRELAGLKRAGGAAQVAVDAAKESTKAWDKFADSVYGGLTDSLYRAFEAGGKFFDTLWKGVVNTFKTTVLKLGVQAIVGGVSGSLGLSGTANAATGASSMLSGGSSIFSAGSTLAGVSSFMGELGTGLLASTQSALGLTATAAQASYAATMGVAAQTGSLIGSLGPLITAAPYLVALAGVYMLAKNLDHSGTPHTGGGSQYSGSGGLQTTANATFNGGFTGIGSSQGTMDMTSGVVQGIVGILDSTAVAFGKSAGYQAATSFADDSSKDGSWGSLVITKLGETVTDWAATQTSKWAPKVFSDGSAGSAEYLTAISADVQSQVRTILAGTDWAVAMVDALGSAPSLDQLAAVVALINKTELAFIQIGEAMTGFGAISEAGKAKVTAAAGGIDALATSASAYYEAFATEDEKRALGVQQYTAALQAVNQQIPTSIAAYKDQVKYLESIVDTEPSAAAALATMYRVGPAFATLNPVIEAVTEAIPPAVEVIKGLGLTVEEIASQRTSLQDQIDLLTGAKTARQIESKAIDSGNMDLFDRITVLQANKTATDALIESEKALAAERTSLMDQLWAATGQTAQIRAKQLAGLGPANRPIQQALYDVADAQTAFTTLQTTIQTEKDRITQQYNDDKTALQEQAKADFSGLKDAADAQKTAIQAELKIKQAGYADQISAAQDARSAISGIASSLASAVKSVKVESEAYDLIRLKSARATIAGAAASGNIRAAGLEDALGVAGQDSKQFYSTFEEYAFAQSVTAGEIAKLNDSAQSQLSGVDQTIAALKASDDLAKLLADAQLKAIDAQYQLDLGTAQTAAALAAEGTAAQLAALDLQYQHDIDALDKTLGKAQEQLNALLGISPAINSVADALGLYTTAINAAVTSVAHAAATDAAAQTASAIGTAMSSSAAAVGAPAGGSSESAAALGIMGFSPDPFMGYVPKYAAGGTFAGGLRIVGENGPELEATGPSRIWNAAQISGALRGGGGGGNNAELVAEVRALRAELAAQNRAIATNTLESAKTLKRWEGDGMPEVRTV